MNIKFLFSTLLFHFLLPAYSQYTEAEYLENYNKRILQERINDVYIPKDLKDALKELDRLTDKNKAASLLTSIEDTIASKLHYSLGRWMSLHWGLEEGSRLSANLKSRGLSYPDDMIDFLIRCWYRHLSKNPLNEEELIKNYLQIRKEEYFKKMKSIDTIRIEQKPKN